MPATPPADETLILERVQNRILSIRGQRVIKDVDLASLYGVPTKRLNEQVKRNADRFPSDFAFRLTSEEVDELVANCDQFTNSKHSSQFPLVFTEHGVIAAAFVLNAPRAVEVSTFIVRAFVQLRRMSTEVATLAQRLEKLEQETTRRFKDTEGHLHTLFKALRDLLNQSQTPDATPVPPKRSIGFRSQRK